ncbi:major facilitator superfamily transporter [Apiospora hydei]|uniref:Major facilitator superfamily transporter n=1 Tax=Apiospora hydei TaxID=1337664 RepID=A0ABR1X0B5_9PEZI
MAAKEHAPRAGETAGIVSETAPLLGPAASGQGDTVAPQISKSNGTSAHGTFSRDTMDPEPTSGDGDIIGANGHEPKIKVNMAQLLPALGIGIFLVAMDQTLTIATYGKMGSDLNALNNTSWIATSYFLTLTTFQPLYGRLSDIFGRKECLLFAYSVFGIGCLGCGLAQDIVQLVSGFEGALRILGAAVPFAERYTVVIYLQVCMNERTKELTDRCKCIARGVAGMGGGGMNAVVAILVTDLVSLRDRGVWQGYINIVFGAGIASGAPIGGLLADSIGWRWAFAGQFPIAILAWLAVFTMLPSPEAADDGDDDDAKQQQQQQQHWRQKLLRIDFLGGFALSAAAFVLLFGLDNGANEGWSRPITVVPLALTPVLFAIFIFIEVKVATEPFAPGHMGVFFFIAMFYQGAMALTATQSGLMFTPSTLLGLTGSLGGGLVMRKTGKYYGLTLTGYTILLFSVVPLVLFTGALTKSVVGVVIGVALLALGASISITTTLIAIIANCAPEDMAMAVACSYLFRSLGTTIGISLSTAVLQQVLRTELAARLQDGGRAAEIEEHVRQSLDYIRTLPPHVADTVRDCYAVATTWAFLPIALLAGLCLLSTTFIREKKLDR